MGIYAITGASSGIGAAIGRQLKAQGHYVINISRRAAAEDAADVNISADLAMKAERGRVLEALYAAAPDVRRRKSFMLFLNRSEPML